MIGDCATDEHKTCIVDDANTLLLLCCVQRWPVLGHASDALQAVEGVTSRVEFWHLWYDDVIL